MSNLGSKLNIIYAHLLNKEPAINKLPFTLNDTV